MDVTEEIGKLKIQDTFQKTENDIIVAIDFGTSRTGVVWGIRKNIPNEVLEVQPLDGTGVITEDDKKTLTAVLLNRNQKHDPIAFGYKAREAYSDEDHEKDYFFRCFKMKLHNQFHLDPDVCAANTKKLPLSIVIEKSFEFIKMKVLDSLYNRGIMMTRDPHQIIWSLTVPAIWTDVAKFIMRKAAFNAGMIKPETSDKLIIALEPECAFIGAMKAFEYDQSIYGQNKKFLIVDCGGGTIDITGHEIQTIEPLTVREIICPDGGHMGSTLIDKKFFEFLNDFLGQDRYEEISNLQEFIELEKIIEECKLRFTFDNTTSELTRINLATVFFNFEKDLIRKLVDDWNSKYPDKEIRKCGKHVIGLSYPLMMSFFTQPIENIVQKVEKVIEDNIRELDNLDYIILAGGFCKNKYLIQRMNQQFYDQKNIRVLYTKEADLLIVRGAALFGCDPSSIIKIRKAKYTFGISYAAIYDDTNERHTRFQNNRFIASDGNTRLRAFRIHGKIGDDIEVGKTTTRSTLVPISPEQDTVYVDILVSNEVDPVCIYEDSVRKLATANHIELNMDVPFKDRGITVKFSFGSTEVVCCVCSLSGEFLRWISLDYSKFFA